ncbi:MAG: DUF2889 domain-containing protein [Proteobacteria bacterium]|nr:DUF2889 domain-containing protein [Pseudomonadota bacterium]
MTRERGRRILDGRVRAEGEDRLSVEIFISDDGLPLNLTIDYRFSDRQVLSARLETAMGLERNPWLSIRDLPELAGLGVGPGLVRQARSALADTGTPPALLDAVIESARLMVQVNMLDPERIRSIDPSDTPAWRELDLTIWPELQGGCLPYSPDAVALIEDRKVMLSCRPDIYAPQPGQSLRFRRDKVLAWSATPVGDRLSGVLSDDVHELEVDLVVSPYSGETTAVTARSLRSPYPGLCDQPFPRAASLTRLNLNMDFRRHVWEAVGGGSGCVHLADLIVDLVRYYQSSGRCGRPL